MSIKHLQQLREAQQAAASKVRKVREFTNNHHFTPVWAGWRQGLGELSQALAAFPDSNIRPVSEQGQIGTVVPQEVYQQKTGAEARKVMAQDMGLDR